ncbi:glycoside hydrolase family 105 protein [Luteolibacter algae]|uniref:Glycoside hydrolase family 105 protein n=1 Tax=Luteolibacter algae TaxID=454151 RepID=A0ABW5DAN7_9BACT
MKPFSSFKSLCIGIIFLSSAASGVAATEPSPQSVKAICEKVAEWQIESFEEQGKYRALPTTDRRKWHHRNRYPDMNWNNGALYAGMFEWSTIAGDPKFTDWLRAIGDKNSWDLHVNAAKGSHHADAHAVGISHLKMHEQFGDPEMIAPTRGIFDEILARPDAEEYHWVWADALFMSPPVWAQLSKATGDMRYLEYMDRQYHMTYDELWNAEDQLFYRDKGRIKKREKNGANEYWARGNGWVYGGLTYMLPYLPEDWDGRAFYIDLFRQMSEALIRTQRSDGTWSMGMMGAEADYPSKDISGSSFFVFGMARGINMGILDRTKYEPIVFKGWQALTECVREDGLVGYVQGVGAGPGETFADYTESYGTGGFLAAGAEVYKLVSKTGR